MVPTKSVKASVGTIREDFGNKEIVNENVVHGSDSRENALIEIERFFNLKLKHEETFKKIKGI